MNEVSIGLLLMLLRTTVFLSVAAMTVWLVLGLGRATSPTVHRVAWLLVLAQGWFWCRLPVTIPYLEPTAVERTAATSKEPPQGLPEILAEDLQPGSLNSLSQLMPMRIVERESAVGRAIELTQANPTLEGTPESRSPVEIVRRHWPVVLLGGWAAGMLLLTVCWIVSYGRFLRNLTTTRAADESWTREWNDLLDRRHVRTPISLWAAKDLGPMLCRVPRGYALIVPADLWPRLASAERLSVLRHELSHFQRRDLVKSLLVRLLALPQWFNPLAWLAVRRFDDAAEWACDEAAKGASEQGCRDYAKALLELSEVLGGHASYRVAASGRGLSVRVRRLLNPEVKEDSIVKKFFIFGTVSALTLVCLLRIDLVAQEPAQAAAEVAKKAEGDAMPSVQKPSIDPLLYMPNGCRMIAWWDAAKLRKSSDGKSGLDGDGGLAACLGLHSMEFINRATVGSMSGQLCGANGTMFPGGLGLPPNVTVAALARPVTVPELKENIEKQGGDHPWHEETINAVTMYVHESDKPIAFYLPAEQTLVIGSQELVREVLARNARAQLPGKLTEAWERLDPTWAIGVMTAPPVPNDPARNFLPDDLCEGIEAILVNADMIDEGVRLRCRLSVPCTDTGIAYQARGTCVTFAKLITTQAGMDPQLVDALKSLEYSVDDRCFVLQGTFTTSMFQGNGNATSANAQAVVKPSQQVYSEMSDIYLKGFQYGLMDPQNKEEAGRQLLARARQRHGEYSRDAKLNEAQRMFRDMTEVGDQGFLHAAGWQDLDPKQKADEQRWLGQLSSDNESSRMLAIHALTVLGSKKAVPGILKIAAERREKDNADREAACRALGILGDLSVVPDLVSLTYHYNRDTRFWAQISLVRLTGENFGRDVAAWRQWWQQKGGTPPISDETVAWATSPEMLQWADPKVMEDGDRQVLEMAQKLAKEPQPEPACQEEVIHDIQPDRSIRMTSTHEIENSASEPITTYGFITSDFAKVERITDDEGRPIQFTTEHYGDHYSYKLKLNKPVSMGERLKLKLEVAVASLVQPTGEPDVFRYQMNHSPNAPFAVRQVVVYRLPAGAELLEQSPSMAEALKDGRIELRMETTIPPGGSMKAAFRYRLTEMAK